MGEKETATAEDAAARSATLNVSANPGGSQAGILSAAVSSVGNDATPANPADEAAARLNARPTSNVTIPLSSS